MNELMTDVLRFVFLELGRFNKQISKLETPFEKWIYLLELTTLKDTFFRTITTVNHYYHTATNHDKRYLEKRGFELKRFLYHLRGLLASQWAIEEEISKAQEDVADMVYSSVFAPAEVKRRSRMVTQIYLHLHEEADTVCSLAKESLKRAERRDYIPLSVKLNKGDKVDIDFQIYGEDLLMSERKSVIWQGTFTKCSFSYFVPENIDIDELYCEAHLTINSAMVGEISFTTEIVESPRRIKPEIHSHQFKRIFISYAHADAEFVKGLALAYKFQGVDYFYDRDNINAGDIYEELIYEYIDSADLFILCWSQNAAASEYVDKERRRALSHAYPQKSVKDATLKICPVCIAPKADLPDDMSSIYHFESIV